MEERVEPVQHFNLISSICVEDPDTWKGREFVSFDVDWAHDTVLEYCIDIVEKSGICATWFITHDTPLLERLRANSKFELGVHPNFNGLLDGSRKNGDRAKDIIDGIKAIVPEAKSIRSHSLVSSERLIDSFHDAGLTHVSNTFIPQSTTALSPWRLWSDMTMVPHCWQDNVSMRLNGTLKPPLTENASSIMVYDFHPIHIYLNTDSMKTYEDAREHFYNMDELRKRRNDSEFGSEDALKKVLGRQQ